MCLSQGKVTENFLKKTNIDFSYYNIENEMVYFNGKGYFQFA